MYDRETHVDYTFGAQVVSLRVTVDMKTSNDSWYVVVEPSKITLALQATITKGR